MIMKQAFPSQQQQATSKQQDPTLPSQERWLSDVEKFTAQHNYTEKCWLWKKDSAGDFIKRWLEMNKIENLADF